MIDIEGHWQRQYEVNRDKTASNKSIQSVNLWNNPLPPEKCGKNINQIDSRQDDTNNKSKLN